jgi:hypothetical protein
VAAVAFYPSLDIDLGAPEVVLAALLVLLAGAPFAGVGARLGVARG